MTREQRNWLLEQRIARSTSPDRSASVSDQLDLAWVDRTGTAEPLELQPDSYQHVRVSRDGKRLTFGTDDGKEANVHAVHAGERHGHSAPDVRGHNRFPIWAADGKRIAFQSDREGDLGIFWQPVDGARAERLTKADEGTSHVPEAWAPDGNRLLYTVTKGLERDVVDALVEGKNEYARRRGGIVGSHRRRVFARRTVDRVWTQQHGLRPTLSVDRYPVSDIENQSRPSPDLVTGWQGVVLRTGAVSVRCRRGADAARLHIRKSRFMAGSLRIDFAGLDFGTATLRPMEAIHQSSPVPVD